jgi:glycosyltransferase involved in cell wall biosynthesis
MKKVSMHCLTYGRPKYLEEAVNCFLRQDYEGPKELVILNDLANQTIEYNHPNIKVFNEAIRYPTLGEKRNACIERCTGDIILVLDDDDIVLDRHINTAVRLLGDSDFFYPNKALMMVNYNQKIENVIGGVPAQVIFTKDTWQKAGGYPKINSGEDQHFIHRLSKFKGGRCEVSLDDITYLFSWANGAHHLQGYGDDKPGEPTGLERIQERVEYDLRAGTIPSGVIKLEPRWDRNYNQLVKEYIDNYKKDFKLQ